MAEEFQESEVIFSDFITRKDEESMFYNRENNFHLIGVDQKSHNNTNKNKKWRSTKKNGTTNPIPISVPENVYHNSYVGSDSEFEESEFDDKRITPPHLILERRMEGKMAFSVCTGNGRTLKGRDLRCVRNSVLRMTGFLEA